jgi:hypothetical protein
MYQVFLAKQVKREPFLPWEDFKRQLIPDKIIHVVTDRGAGPNPGTSGWIAPIRQNVKCPLDYGHYDLATNNAMEIMASVAALRVLPQVMHV